MLYITHDIASARYFADEILVMYRGEIVERGPAEQVTQSPSHEYTRLLIASAPDPDAFGRQSGLEAMPLEPECGRISRIRPRKRRPLEPRWGGFRRKRGPCMR